MIDKDIEFIEDALTSIRDRYKISVEKGSSLKVVKKINHGIFETLDRYAGERVKYQATSIEYTIKIAIPREPKINRFDSDHTILEQYFLVSSKYHQELSDLYIMISEFSNRISDNFEMFDFKLVTQWGSEYIHFGIIKI